MRKSHTQIALSATIATFVAALLVGPGATASPRVETFRGICNVEGTSSVDTYSFGSSEERMVFRGSCIGSVNGEAVKSHTVRMVTVASPSMIDLKTRGYGWTRFDGFQRSLRFNFARIAERQLLVSGARNSRAEATLQREAGERHVLLFEAGLQLRGL